jgi:hypothetical protein
MNCNCENIYDQDCRDLACQEERQKTRTALFDFMKCADIEALEGWDKETEE